MKKQINVLFCMTFATLLSACNAPKSPDVNVKIPDIKVDPKTEELLAAFSTCNKSDSELPLAQLDPNENITVKDTIENKDIIEVNCDKKQTPKGRGPVRELSQLLTIEAPADLSEKVNYVTIENSRTCSVQKIDAKDDMFLEQTKIELEGQAPIILPKPTTTVLGFSGKLKIMLSDSTFKFPTLYLNVHDNNNVVTIQYYGKCLKYKEKKAEIVSDAYNCAEAELLGQKQFLLSVLVERPEAEGTKVNNICTK